MQRRASLGLRLKLTMAKQRQPAPIAHLWAVRSDDVQSSLPRQLVIQLEGPEKGVRLSVAGWSVRPPDSGWTYNRITKNLDEIEIEWTALHGAGWTLEVREKPRQQVAPVPKVVVVTNNVRIRVRGWIEFGSVSERRVAVVNALGDEHASDCVFLAEDLNITGARVTVTLDERQPSLCWNATVRVLLTLAQAAVAGDLTADLQESETVIRFKGDPGACAHQPTYANSRNEDEAPSLGLAVTINGQPFADNALPPLPPRDDGVDDEHDLAD